MVMKFDGSATSPAAGPSSTQQLDAQRANQKSDTPLIRVLQSLVGVVVALVAWETVSALGLFPANAIPSMTATFAQLVVEVQGPVFWQALLDTLTGWAIGLSVAFVLAVPLGLLIGSNYFMFRATRVGVEFMRPIPAVALIPLAVLMFGIGTESKVFIVLFGCFWILLYQTIYGVRDIDPVAMDTARIFGLGRTERLVRVALPSAMPYIATGFRIASTVALILAVTAELVIGSPGLGREILLAQSGGAVASMYALIIATGSLGWLLNIAATNVERRLLSWHTIHREKSE